MCECCSLAYGASAMNETRGHNVVVTETIIFHLIQICFLQIEHGVCAYLGI